MNKNEIRNQLRLKRNALTPMERQAKTQLICKSLFSLAEFQNARIVCTYISFTSEVGTRKIIEECQRLGKTVVVPVADTTQGELMPVLFLSFDQLQEGPFGVPEPTVKKNVPIKSIDLVIVPALAFDEHKNRLGFGKGFFDRFLAKLGQTPFIGLAFECQILSILPTAPHDIKVSKIVTENRVF